MPAMPAFNTWISDSGIFIKNVPGSHQCSGEKILNTGITNAQCSGALAEFFLTAKPVLTKFIFSDIFKMFIIKRLT